MVVTAHVLGKLCRVSFSLSYHALFSSWKRWEPRDETEYGVMIYEGGEKCWNGPERSMKVAYLCIRCKNLSLLMTRQVTVQCGLENQLASVSEPSRCEYAMTFAFHDTIHTVAAHV